MKTLTCFLITGKMSNWQALQARIDSDMLPVSQVFAKVSYPMSPGKCDALASHACIFQQAG